MRWPVVLGAVLALSACGRIGFDATGDGGTVGDGNADGQLNDASGNGLRLNLTFENAVVDVAENHTVICESTCPTFVPGRSGGMAGSFGGTACLIVGDDVVFKRQTFTLALWMRGTTSADTTMIGKPYLGATTGENSWELWKTPSNGLRFATTPDGTANGGNIPLNSWHHVAGTFDGGTLRIHVDGILEQTTFASAVEYATDVVRIGCDFNTGTVTGYFIGELDDVLVYDRVLSTVEIAALAQ